MHGHADSVCSEWGLCYWPCQQQRGGCGANIGDRAGKLKLCSLHSDRVFCGHDPDSDVDSQCRHRIEDLCSAIERGSAYAQRQCDERWVR